MSRKSITADRIHDRLRALDQKANVSGYIILRGADHVGTVRFSYPRDGAGKLICLAADWTAERPRNATSDALAQYAIEATGDVYAIDGDIPFFHWRGK